jgi:hypothetical protein
MEERRLIRSSTLAGGKSNTIVVLKNKTELLITANEPSEARSAREAHPPLAIGGLQAARQAGETTVYALIPGR